MKNTVRGLLEAAREAQVKHVVLELEGEPMVLLTTTARPRGTYRMRIAKGLMGEILQQGDGTGERPTVVRVSCRKVFEWVTGTAKRQRRGNAA